MLLLAETPEAAYRRIAFDARIASASPQDLVHLCLEQVIFGLGAAIRAHEAGNPARRSGGLTRAYAALAALEMGVDQSAEMASALMQFYGAARETILEQVTHFDSAMLARMRDDFQDIAAAFAG